MVASGLTALPAKLVSKAALAAVLEVCADALDKAKKALLIAALMIESWIFCLINRSCFN